MVLIFINCILCCQSLSHVYLASSSNSQYQLSVYFPLQFQLLTLSLFFFLKEILQIKPVFLVQSQVHSWPVFHLLYISVHKQKRRWKNIWTRYKRNIWTYVSPIDLVYKFIFNVRPTWGVKWSTVWLYLGNPDVRPHKIYCAMSCDLFTLNNVNSVVDTGLKFGGHDVIRLCLFYYALPFKNSFSYLKNLLHLTSWIFYFL